jgi:hypothetical protein
LSEVHKDECVKHIAETRVHAGWRRLLAVGVCDVPKGQGRTRRLGHTTLHRVACCFEIACHSEPFAVILSPSLVILSGAKNLALVLVQ